MRAVVLERTGGPLRVVERAEPQPTGDQQVITVTACGICHSDLHVVAGDYNSPLPLVLGHEVTGEHPELGPVMVYACWGCREPDCWACASGQEMICPRSHEAGLVDDGGYAEQMLVPDRSYLVPLGDLDPVQVAPLACGGLTAFRAVGHTLPTLRAARPGGGRRRALVMGAGGLGQFGLQFLRQQSDAEVVVVDTSATKRAEALRLGADAAVEPAELDGSFDAVVDFVGAQATLEATAQHVARQGVAVVVGLYGGRIPFGMGAVPHEARFLTSIWGTRDQLAELLAHVAVHPLASPVEAVPLEQAQEAHDRLAAGDVAGRLVLVTGGAG